MEETLGRDQRALSGRGWTPGKSQSRVNDFRDRFRYPHQLLFTSSRSHHDSSYLAVLTPSRSIPTGSFSTYAVDVLECLSDPSRLPPKDFTTVVPLKVSPSIGLGHVSPVPIDLYGYYEATVVIGLVRRVLPELLQAMLPRHARAR